MALYDKIQEAWKIARNNGADPLLETPEVEHARQLEQLLADRFEPHLEQYNEGLISASELFQKLFHKASLPIADGEL